MTEQIRHKGRLAQTGIYLGKFLRMFVYQNDWKLLPMGAVIAAIVVFVVGGTLFQYQEGTKLGVFALVCACIWNGFFNSIQVVCREREIIKHEHRSGLHMSAYVLAQTVVTLIICSIAGVKIPTAGVVTPWGLLDVGISILLITYTADMMALMVSCIVRTTTTAMTTMPFLLIFQLVFSGGFFSLTGFADKIKLLTVSHWGMDGLCSIGRYNEQPMVAVWNMIVGFKDLDVFGYTPLKDMLIYVEEHGYRDPFLEWCGQHNQLPQFAATVENVLYNWGVLLLMMVVFALASIIALEFIDRDKR